MPTGVKFRYNLPEKRNSGHYRQNNRLQYVTLCCFQLVLFFHCEITAGELVLVFFFEATGGELVLVSTVFNKLGNGVHCCVSIILQNCTHFQLSLFILCICCSVDKYNHFLIEKKKEISCQPVYLFFLFFFPVSLGCPDGL